MDTYSYIILADNTLYARIDYPNGDGVTVLREDCSLLSADYLALVAAEQGTDERGALDYLGVVIVDEEVLND